MLGSDRFSDQYFLLHLWEGRRFAGPALHRWSRGTPRKQIWITGVAACCPCKALLPPRRRNQEWRVTACAALPGRADDAQRL